jgi:ABC-type glycerol-3-phosphate transport system substrate-binding protein
MRRLTIAIAGGALLIAACGGGGNSVAATVNGADITTGDVEGLL